MTTHTKLKLTPSHVLMNRISGYFPPDYYMHSPARFAVYQWFCQRFYKFDPKNPKWEQLNGTSSINNREIHTLYSDDEPLRRLGELFCKFGCNQFLQSVGLSTWADLSQPKILTVPWCDEFPNRKWFDLCGREFKVGPNSCHAKATCVFHAGLKLSYRAVSWSLNITYGYKHDSSAWEHEVRQKDDEPLDDFTIRVDKELAELFLPEEQGRVEVERDWQRVYSGLKDCFYEPRWDGLGWEKEVTDLVMPTRKGGIGGIGSRKITLDLERINTLKHWIENPILICPEAKADVE